MNSERRENGYPNLLLPEDSLIVENRWVLRFKINRTQLNKKSRPRNIIKVITPQELPVRITRTSYLLGGVFSYTKDGYSVTGYRMPSRKYDQPVIEVDGKIVEAQWAQMPGPFIMVTIEPAPMGAVRVTGVPTHNLGEALAEINRR